MALSSGKTGRSITFAIDAGDSPSEFTVMANVTSISNSGRDAEEIDFTHLGSTGGFREYRQGFKDGGTISVDFHFDPTNASHVLLATAWNSGELFTWRINYVGAGWDKFEEGQGFVQNPGDRTIDVSNPVSGSATIRVTGASNIIDSY